MREHRKLGLLADISCAGLPWDCNFTFRVHSHGSNPLQSQDARSWTNTLSANSKMFKMFWRSSSAGKIHSPVTKYAPKQHPDLMTHPYQMCTVTWSCWHRNWYWWKGNWSLHVPVQLEAGVVQFPLLLSPGSIWINQGTFCSRIQDKMRAG